MCPLRFEAQRCKQRRDPHSGALGRGLAILQNVHWHCEIYPRSGGTTLQPAECWQCKGRCSLVCRRLWKDLSFGCICSKQFNNGKRNNDVYTIYLYYFTLFMHRGTWSSEDIALQCVSHHFTMSFGELQDCIVWSIKQFQGRGHSCSVHLYVGTQRRKSSKMCFFLALFKIHIAFLVDLISHCNGFHICTYLLGSSAFELERSKRLHYDGQFRATICRCREQRCLHEGPG